MASLLGEMEDGRRASEAGGVKVKESRRAGKHAELALSLLLSISSPRHRSRGRTMALDVDCCGNKGELSTGTAITATSGAEEEAMVYSGGVVS